MFGAGVDIHMRIDASLRDQLQIWQYFNEFCANLRSFSEKNECLYIGDPFRQSIGIRFMISPNRDVVILQQVKTRQRSERVEPVV